MKKYTIVKMQKHAWAHSNKVYISKDFLGAYCAFNGFVFRVETDEALAPGTVSLSQIQREVVGAELGSSVNIAPISISSRAVIASIDISLQCKSKLLRPRISEDAAQIAFRDVLDGVPLTAGQQIYLLLQVEDEAGAEHAALFVCTVDAIETLDRAVLGVVRQNTTVHIKEHPEITVLGKGAGLKLSRALNFQQLEIGGLHKEFGEMFRRVFIQRTYPPDFIKKMGISHVKGIMLYGPPGTGKTLIARKISNLLNSEPPKIVNGPEILNKYVGQSEENIRKLFEDAESDYRKYGDKSPLHVIIFDEIDAICKSRGSSNGVGDQVVNQLLSKLDGVDYLNNLLVFGMTNRLDLIDDALLRPGRFEVHIEISLPDAKGRLEILKIHTGKMEANCFLGADIDMPSIADLARNYTGAEITALVKSAASFALERSKQNEEEVVVGMKDFERALQETTPSFGITKALLPPDVLFQYPSALSILEIGRKMIGKLKNKKRTSQKNSADQPGAVKEGPQKTAPNTPEPASVSKTLSLLISGSPGTGKTTLAETIARTSEIPFVRVIAPRDLVGMEENEKVHYIKKTFKDAYRSEEALVVLDDIEGLMDYVTIGPRFSNAVLQAIKIFAKNQDRNKVFVLGTTADLPLMKESGIFLSFDEHASLSLITEEDAAWFEQNTDLIRARPGQTVREIVQ